MTNQILALRDHLIAEQVTLVVMEATSDYWKPIFYLLEDGPFEVMLDTPSRGRNLRTRAEGLFRVFQAAFTPAS